MRGYHEGEVFGDDRLALSLEQQTPPHMVGMIHGDIPVTVRGSVYMDWATAYLIDPKLRPGSVEFWGTGFGFAASVGSYLAGASSVFAALDQHGAGITRPAVF